MDRDRQVLRLLNQASDMLEAQGDFLVVAQLSHPIATIEARLAASSAVDAGNRTPSNARVAANL